MHIFNWMNINSSINGNVAIKLTHVAGFFSEQDANFPASPLKVSFFSSLISVKVIIAAIWSENGAAIQEMCAYVSYLQVEARALRHKSERHHCRDARQRTHNHEHPPAVELVGRTHAEAPACKGGEAVAWRGRGEKSTQRCLRPYKQQHLSVWEQGNTQKKKYIVFPMWSLRAESAAYFNKFVKWKKLL